MCFQKRKIHTKERDRGDAVNVDVFKFRNILLNKYLFSFFVDMVYFHAEVTSVLTVTIAERTFVTKEILEGGGDLLNMLLIMNRIFLDTKQE